MAKNNREEKKKPQGKMKLIPCTMCKKAHDVPANQMAQHRKDVQRLGARQVGSRAG